MRYLAIDTETTGMKENALIQICAKPLIGYPDHANEYHVEYHNPGKPIETGAKAVHHIIESQIEIYPPFNSAVFASHFASAPTAFSKEVVIVAHNADFDQMVLKKTGLEFAGKICTLKCAMRLFPGLEAYNLSFLRYHFDLPVPETCRPHDAKSDVIVLELLFWHLLSKLMERPDFQDQQEKALEAMMEISKFDFFMFGKHKGKTMSQVVRDDKKYFDWLMKEELKKEHPNLQDIATWKKYI